MVEFAAVAVAVAFVVLVGYLIPTVLQVKRTISQSERLLARLNNELPVMLKDIRGTSENIRSMTDQARVGVDRGNNFLERSGRCRANRQAGPWHRAWKGRGLDAWTDECVIRD